MNRILTVGKPYGYTKYNMYINKLWSILFYGDTFYNDNNVYNYLPLDMTSYSLFQRIENRFGRKGCEIFLPFGADRVESKLAYDYMYRSGGGGFSANGFDYLRRCESDIRVAWGFNINHVEDQEINEYRDKIITNLLDGKMEKWKTLTTKDIRIVISTIKAIEKSDQVYNSFISDDADIRRYPFELSNVDFIVDKWMKNDKNFEIKDDCGYYKMYQRIVDNV